MASEGRGINQLLFFIFDKVIKTLWFAARAAQGPVCGQPFPRGEAPLAGVPGLLRGSEMLSPPSVGKTATSLPAVFPLGRKQGSLQAEQSHVEGG